MTENLVSVPEILIPKNSVDLKKWCVIACDQFTGQPDYWKSLDDYCGDVSTLRIIYPEVYLSLDRENRIKNINAKMREYLDGGVFDTVNGFILTVRKTKYGNKRIGIILAFDLERYDIDEKLDVRATEATVKERIPVRVEIRKNAPIELPHSLLLIDDEQKTVIEPVYNNRKNLKKLYSTELNMGGGSVEGYLIEDTESVISALKNLTSSEKLISKYGSDSPFTFAVGDGNHSIATAKACWELIKKDLSAEERLTHPARYCLAQVNNIYDDDLKFEPIHRVVKNVGVDFIEKMRDSLKGEGVIGLLFDGREYPVNVDKSTAKAIADVQRFIDGYIAENADACQDYIHGLNELKSIVSRDGGVGVVMPTLKKADLFKYVSKFGALTRKSFSMGEAEEKRYYLECRKITI